MPHEYFYFKWFLLLAVAARGLPAVTSSISTHNTQVRLHVTLGPFISIFDFFADWTARHQLYNKYQRRAPFCLENTSTICWTRLRWTWAPKGKSSGTLKFFYVGGAGDGTLALTHGKFTLWYQVMNCWVFLICILMLLLWELTTEKPPIGTLWVKMQWCYCVLFRVFIFFVCVWGVTFNSLSPIPCSMFRSDPWWCSDHVWCWGFERESATYKGSCFTPVLSLWPECF